MFQKIAAALATGKRAHVQGLPKSVASRLTAIQDESFEAALLQGGAHDVIALQLELAVRSGAIVALPSAPTSDSAAGMAYRADRLCNEVSTSANTTAAGGNASLMAMSA